MTKKLQNSILFDIPGRKSRKKRFTFSVKQVNGAAQINSLYDKEERAKVVIERQSNDLSIEEICFRHRISAETFNEWTKDFLSNPLVDDDSLEISNKDSQDYRFRAVLEGKTGVYSVAEICRRERISHDEFLDWSKEFKYIRDRNSIIRKLNNPVFKRNQSIITNKSSIQVANYCENYIDLDSVGSVVILNHLDKVLEEKNNIRNLVNLERINDIRYINKYFEKVNSKLSEGGLFMGCLETFSARKNSMKINRVPIINSLYFSIEFLIKRIIPKVSFSKKYYFDITKGNDRLLSKAEGLGRLVSCGFQIMDYKTIDNLIYFVVKKVREPYFDESPSYGPIYKMPRLGKNGKTIGVYKFRTMHPYSEYLQDYIVRAHGYAETGKPANDFRIPDWGKLMRRFWLDEIPQLFNVLKGELKLVGVRPVSERYFQDIPREMQKLRSTQKPGCIPPYVALNREGNVMSVLQAEKDYLEEKIKNPYTTDMKYFVNALVNIFFKNKRSA